MEKKKREKKKKKTLLTFFFPINNQFSLKHCSSSTRQQLGRYVPPTIGTYRTPP